MSKTQENLKTAFAGESQANRRYLAFAKVAEKEGKDNLARLFRAIAQGETIHALNHLATLGEVKDSVENLKAAIQGETYEFEKMYPEFIKEAQDEEEKSAKVSFERANSVEKLHQKMYSEALETIQINNDLEEEKYFVCEVCGYLAKEGAPNNCPVCGASKENFSEIK